MAIEEVTHFDGDGDGGGDPIVVLVAVVIGGGGGKKTIGLMAGKERKGKEQSFVLLFVIAAATQLP